MPKEKVTPPVENQEQEVSTIKPFECWNVEVTYKKVQNPETFEVESVPEFKKKGDAPVKITHIEQHHADTLNAQVGNSKQYYYPKD